jgi:N-acetylmuramoyl-L-alanine amidase
MKKQLTVLFLFCFLNSYSQKNYPDFFYVRTNDSLPFLDYGLGEDRLGGAKMTFLDSNVVLRVIDSTGDKYKVQLSKLHSAYIQKEKVHPINQFYMISILLTAGMYTAIHFTIM